MLNYRYRLNPSDAHRETLDRHLNLYRQVYNHFLHRLNRVERYNDTEDTEVGMGCAESTPAETVVPTSIAPMAVDANHVVETGSPRVYSGE
jgi:hypothetical protein